MVVQFVDDLGYFSVLRIAARRKNIYEGCDVEENVKVFRVRYAKVSQIFR